MAQMTATDPAPEVEPVPAWDGALEAELPPDDFADEVLGQVVAEDPDYVFALVSGGNDSMTMLHVALAHPEVDVDAVVHLNTGIGLEGTRQYVRDRCRDWGVAYMEVTNRRPGEQYADMVLDDGFPGVHGHVYAYRKLKERALDKLYQNFPGKLVFLSGARRHESRRRMATVPYEGLERRKRFPRVLWASPVANWTGSELRDYRGQHGIPTNDFAEVLDMSGECLCNAFGTFWDLGYIVQLDLNLAFCLVHLMDLALRIHDGTDTDVPPWRAIWGWDKLKDGVIDDLFPGQRKAWEERQPSDVDQRADEARQDDDQPDLFTLCSSCEVPRGER